MEYFLLPKRSLNEWVDAIRQHYQLFSPSRQEGEIFFTLSEGSLALDLISGKAVLPYLPPKDLVFPQSEVLFSFSKNGSEFKLYPAEERLKKSVIFGIRSCDASGIAWMDKFYSGSFRDYYYWRRRQNLVLVTIACNQPVQNCFCICCEGGPYLNQNSEAFDIQLVDLEGSYLVECRTSAGKELISLNSRVFLRSDLEFLEKRKQLEEIARRSFLPEPTSYMSSAIRKITANSIKPAVWTELGERCFDCGGCSFVCPLCSCFGVGYLSKGSGGCHYRYWDSCDYSGFTREVSGHNPREEKGERFKRRFFHKLSYQYVKRDGRIGCVGCGRCITVCPGEVSMPVVVERIRKEK